MDGSMDKSDEFLNRIVNGCNKENLFHLLASRSSRKIYNSMFEYLNDVGKEMGQEQAFYTFDLADILWKLQLWKKKLPDVRPYYAVKVNSDPVILRLLVLLGLSFDCATEGEIRMVMEAGGNPRNIVFAHTFKTPRALKYASSIGVDLMTFDAEEELIKIHEEYPETRLLLRLSPEEIHCAFDLSEKFGCKMEEVHFLLSRAKELNLKVVGVSFHVGALCTDPGSFVSTICNTRKVFDEAKKLGFKFTIVDIGGGFFGSKEREKIFLETSEKIKAALKENFPEKDVEFIAEPGCYFVGSAITLTTAIIGKKSIPNSSSSKDNIRRHYFLNDGIYGSFFRNIETYDVRPVPLLKDMELKKRHFYCSRLWGQTCCSEDMIRKKSMLPDMEIGEFIVWQNMGAYSHAVCSTFCAVPIPASKHIIKYNSLLKTDFIPNLEKVVDYLKDVTHLIENGECEQERIFNGYMT